MSVFDNVDYGLRVRKLSNSGVADKVNAALALVQMQSYAQRSASKLSGGQQQRVALARSIAFSPRVLLFDEPLSNLDAKLRAEVRVELRELQQKLGITSLYVTHDQEEALAISDRIIVMNRGRIEQIGPPEEIYNQPTNRFVADFVGAANLIGSVIVATADKTPRLTFKTEAGVLLQVCASRAATGNVELVAIRASHIQFSLAPEANNAPGKIRRRMFHGNFVQYLVATPMGDLVVRRPDGEHSGGQRGRRFIRPGALCASLPDLSSSSLPNTRPLLDERLRISAKILQSLLTNSIFPIY